MSCTVQGLVAVQLDLHLDAKVQRSSQHAALDATIIQMFSAARNPAQPPLSPLPLLANLNPCLALAQLPLFNHAQGWDAASFLSALLGELTVQQGFMVENVELGVCQQCGNQWQQAYTAPHTQASTKPLMTRAWEVF